MATTDNLQITLVEQSQAQKEVTMNNALAALDYAVAGKLLKTTTGGTLTLTATEARNAIIEVSGTLTSNVSLVVPAKTKPYIVRNGTTGSFTLTVKTAAGAGVVVAQSKRKLVYCDGVDVVLGDDVVAMQSADITDFTEAVQDAVAAMISGGSHSYITIDYNDAAGTMSFTGSAPGGGGGGGTIGKALLGYWPAQSLKQNSTAGCAAVSWDESTTNDVMVPFCAFDAASVEYAQIAFKAPAALDESLGFTARFEWAEASGATTHDVVWCIEMQAQSDGDTIDSAWGTAVTIIDTGSSGLRHVSGLTGTITPGGTYAAGDLIIARISRKATDAADTLNVDAKLIGLSLFATYDTLVEP